MLGSVAEGGKIRRVPRSGGQVVTPQGPKSFTGPPVMLPQTRSPQENEFKLGRNIKGPTRRAVGPPLMRRRTGLKTISNTVGEISG